MIPILYDADETSFVNNGIGRLSDAVSCTVSEALNGAYTLTMIYPKDGIHASDITYRRILVVQANEGIELQRFRIVKIQDSMSGRRLTITAQHISYDLNGYPMGAFEATGIQEVIDAFEDDCLVNHDFTFQTNLTNSTSQFKVKFPKSIRACIGGMEGSVIQLFKCELLFNNNEVHFLSKRFSGNNGGDNGATVKYGKNLESFVNIRSTEAAYNGVLAYWYDSQNDSLVSGTVQYAADTDFPTDRIFILDKSSDYDSAPTVAQLNQDAQTYITDNNIGRPYLDSVTVKFVPLWQTEEYKNIVGLEQVFLGDTVHVHYESYIFTVRVIEYTYDSLNERYTDIVLGDKKASFADTIKQVAIDATNELLNR